jgi:ABC-2 type transport system permease protein
VGTNARTIRFTTQPISLRSRLFGLGTIYGKTVRDSLRAMLIVAGLASLFMFATGAPYGATPEFATIELRQQFIRGLTALPLALRGLLGEPIHIETLGGFLSWRIGNVLPVMLGLWSVLALSGTLAGEASKGSLDMLAATPHARRSIALQKVAGHLTTLVLAMLITGVVISIVGVVFARLPGDEIAPSAAFGQVALYGLLMVASGSVAFAAAPFVGRTRALAFGLAALFAPYLVSSYASLSDTIGALKPLSWYAWTAGHRPMAGVSDWASVGLLALVSLWFLAIGVIAFGRRDIGNASALSWLRLPSLPAGIHGPFTRQLADRAAAAIAWGIGIGVYAALIVASAKAFSESLASLPQIADLIKTVYPDIDITEPSGLLQLTFFGFATVMVGIAAATFLMSWAGDEHDGRLAVVMSAPLRRSDWLQGSGLGVYGAIALLTVVLAVIVAVAVMTQGGDVVTPVIGIGILGLATTGFTGLGLVAGGLVRSSLAAPVTGAFVVGTFLLDTLGAALDLPDAVLELSLYKHLGQPMAGTYDLVGIVVALAMALAGLIIGGWGLQRRDLDR